MNPVGNINICVIYVASISLLCLVGACEQQVNTVDQMMKTLEEGSKQRTTAATRMNQSSSRSHGDNVYLYTQFYYYNAADSYFIIYSK
jgi:hypothetical protein